MKIAAYPFAVTGDIRANLCVIRQAVLHAARENVHLLAFPECALTGYPPRNLPSSAAVNWSDIADAKDELQRLADAHEMCIIVGSITRDGECIHNSALIFTPGKYGQYHKRALWGWDKDNYMPGGNRGIFEFAGIRIGIRICYEIRFPEYFRELYREKTDLNIVLFYDVSDSADPERYDLIRAHIRTRAAENVCPVLSVNAAAPYQTAPALLCDRSGRILAESKPGTEGLMVCDFEPAKLDFSENGRRTINDSLLK